MSRLTFLMLALASLVAVGCRGQTSEQAPIVSIRNMYEQPRYDSQSFSPYFQDGRSMRPPVPNTVAREMVVDEVVETGLESDGSYALTIPESVVDQHGGMEELLARGQDRYDIFCVPCHGALGDGQGLVPEVSRVPTIRPPTFHEDRIRHMPDGQLYATIRNGIRNMPAYRHNVPVADRWAIVAYVRALQLHPMDGRTAMATETDR